MTALSQKEQETEMYDQEFLKQALEVKKVVVGMMLNGVVSSGSVVGEDPSGYNLSKLLEYSDVARKHMTVLRIALASIPQTPIVSTDVHDFSDTKSKTDLVLETSGENSYLSISAKRMYKKMFLKPDDGRSYVSIGYLTSDSRKNWSVSYDCMVHSEGKIRVNDWPSNMTYPERQMVLKYYFSPTKLSADQVKKIMGGNDNFQKYTSFLGEFVWNGFRHIQFECNSLEWGKVYADLTDHPIVAEEGKFLLNRGNFRFSVVELGTVKIGGYWHWIYSGSERVEYLK